MYIIINTISALIREFLLPNPFETIIKDKISADIFNILVGGAMLHSLAYFITGCWYTRRINKPASGSIGYLISYTVITFVFILLSNNIESIYTCITIFLIIYVVVCVILRKLLKKSYVKL